MTSGIDETANAKDLNKLRLTPKKADEVSSAPTFIGIWLLLPLAIGGLAFAVVGMFVLALSAEETNQFVLPWKIWLPVTLILQSLYWMRMSHTSGRIMWRGLWALIPLLGMIPLFSVAKSHSVTKS
jgi:hypothetical protein